MRRLGGAGGGKLLSQGAAAAQIGASPRWNRGASSLLLLGSFSPKKVAQPAPLAPRIDRGRQRAATTPPQTSESTMTGSPRPAVGSSSAAPAAPIVDALVADRSTAAAFAASHVDVPGANATASSLPAGDATDGRGWSFFHPSTQPKNQYLRSARSPSKSPLGSPSLQRSEGETPAPHRRPEDI